MSVIWTPSKTAITDEALLERVAALTYAGRPPRHESLIAMLGGLSRYILKDPVARKVPQYVALAYWLRPAALSRLSASLAQHDAPGFLRVPRGVALHLPPTNVDTIFVYSWAMSVLAGNANVVRLSEALSPETQWLVAAVNKVTAEYGEADRQLFCSYDYGGEVERALANLVDLRLIWGGDAKVNAVSRIPIRPDGLSIGFPDRQSLAIIAARAYDNADEEGRNELASNFFNDVFWFDQMGCGSPRVLAWLGDPGPLANDFYGRLQRIIDERSYSVETGVVIGKFLLSNDLLAEGVISNYVHYTNALDVGRTEYPALAVGRSHGGGYISDWVINSIAEVADIVTRKMQTITHFGVPHQELLNLAHHISGRGGYRIVPIGQALAFDVTWDGIELFEHMTRRILIR